MLLSNRRIALLYLCLAGMEAAWITPFWLMIYRPAPSPWAAFGCLLAGLLAWTLVLELLGRAGIRSPWYDLTALALMAITSLLVVRVVLYRGFAPGDFGWLGYMARDIATFTDGFPPALGLVAANLFLWQRATAATSRDLSFFNVGVSFRLGLLLLIAGAVLLAYVRGQSLVAFLWLYFALGLTAVALARIGEKASEAQSAGVPLPMRRFVQLMLAVGVTVGGAWALSAAYTPAGIRRLLHVFDPLWQLARPLIFALLLLIARLLNPFFVWLEARLAAMLRDQAVQMPEMGALTPPGTQPGPFDKLPPWLPQLLKLLTDALLVIGIIVAVIAGIGFLVLYLERVRKGGLRDEFEEEGAERATFGGGILGRGLAAVQNMAGMIRRFGLGGRLLAAVSVQNIYANLSRLARQHGAPRRPAQPPDDYLPVLAQVFGGFEDQLGRITAAYMRVHYGDHPVTLAELAQLREDYRAVRESESANQRMSESANERISESANRRISESIAEGRRHMDRLFFGLGALSGAMAVALGAFGAHGLRARLAADLLATFETGVRYQMYHALALLAVAWAVSRWTGSSLPVAAGWLFVAGTAFFSFSLYLLALTGQRWLGAITPLGGIAFIAGWICLALAAWRR